jgi:pimeloyl-ACP methyl ester carboxylesterase
VTETGSPTGDVVVLVHGWPDTHRVWREQIPVLAEAGYRVVAHDQRGFGASDRPCEVSGSHVFHAMADIGSILDALDIDSAHIVGHDWGAPPCWLFAMFSPDRVRTLVPLSVGHPHAFRNAGMEQQEKSFYMLLFQFVDIAEQWLSADEWANMKTLIGDLENWPAREAELSRPGALTASLNWYRANSGPESLITPPAELPNLTRPTLGVMGRDDWALLDKQMIDSASYVDAEFRYEVVEDAAHWLQTEQPAAVNGLLLDWFETHA